MTNLTKTEKLSESLILEAKTALSFKNGNKLPILIQRDERFGDNKEVLLCAVAENCRNIFSYVSDNLKNDLDFIKQVCLLQYKLTGTVDFSYILDSIKENKSFMKELLETGLPIYDFLSKRLRNDMDIVLASFETIPFSKKMPKRILNDKNVARILVEKGRFNKVGDILKDDINFVKFAINANPLNYMNISDRLKGSQEIVKFVIPLDMQTLLRIPHSLPNYGDLITTALKEVDYFDSRTIQSLVGYGYQETENAVKQAIKNRSTEYYENALKSDDDFRELERVWRVHEIPLENHMAWLLEATPVEVLASISARSEVLTKAIKDELERHALLTITKKDGKIISKGRKYLP